LSVGVNLYVIVALKFNKLSEAGVKARRYQSLHDGEVLTGRVNIVVIILQNISVVAKQKVDAGRRQLIAEGGEDLSHGRCHTVVIW